ncbi:MAG: glutathione peroxidase [Ignavibacteriae bacterium]|nr:glutathione peroxidase [Ignavibacteriota bacterium]
MKKIIIFAILLLNFGFKCGDRTEGKTDNDTEMKSEQINIHDIKVKTTDGREISLSDYKGKVLLIVNVASKCGYTKQYTGLQMIYDRYKEKGFEILAFPCNDFGGQEPGTNEEIKEFCSSKYNVTFQLFDKIKVLGESKSPLYEKLVKYEPAGDISWNFEKFLIDKEGNVTGRFKSKVKPEDEEITSLIEKETAK